MKQGTRGEASLHVDMEPDQLYELVTDVTRMGEWSPETFRCQWLDSVSGPTVGARFKGTNRRGILRWSTKPRVVAADPGHEFAFVVNLVVINRKMTKWSYQFEPAEGGGTTITESFEMVNDMPWYIAFVERSMMGVKDRKADLESAMQQTLERIKVVAEKSA
jgi:hypothetical protein